MVSPTGSGSGAGGTGSLGSPSSPTQREIEASAWTEVNKARLGIVPDSIDVSFSQIDQRYSTSHLGTQTGYRAREDQPLLDHSIESTRILQSLNVPIDASWAATYEHLISQLPPGILARFLLEQQKPLNERDPSFAAMADVLMGYAKILTTVDLHCRSPDPASLEAARTELNLIVPMVAMRQSSINAFQAATKAEEFLNEQGANLPQHDEYQNVITQIKGYAEILSKIDLTVLAKPKGDKAP